jgi:DNA-binding transcriptional MocR family regulator
MSMWKPTLSNREQPLYLAIANAIAQDVSNGRLAEGQRLPPQRDLADELKVALTTVTRAYSEAERRGLVSGEVGRGTFVRRRETFGVRPQSEPTAIDLTANNLPPFALRQDIFDSMSRIVASGEAASIFEYQPNHGIKRHREAGAKLLRSFGVNASPESVLLTNGGQHAMAVVFSAITQPGDTVLTAELTYSGMKSLANFLHIRLRALAMDEEGIRPDALEAACATTEARALYCMPTLQNPTASVMSERRRREIVAIAESYRLVIVEDDSYGFLLPRQSSLWSLAGSEATVYYLTGTSKSLAPGLRVGFLLSPSQMVDRLAASISSTTLMAPSAMAEVVSRWIEDGTAANVMDWKREELRARQKIASASLSAFDYHAHPSSPHGWLIIPEPWNVRDFVAQARMRGVAVSPAEDFIVGRSTSTHAVRLCLGPVEERSRLQHALEMLAEILERPPAPCRALV